MKNNRLLFYILVALAAWYFLVYRKKTKKSSTKNTSNTEQPNTIGGGGGGSSIDDQDIDPDEPQDEDLDEPQGIGTQLIVNTVENNDVTKTTTITRCPYCGTENAEITRWYRNGRLIRTNVACNNKSCPGGYGKVRSAIVNDSKFVKAQTER